jgi:hypothetical protein
LSNKIQIGLTSGILGLLLFGIIIGAYFIQETKNTAEQAKQVAANNTKISQEFDKRVSTFIDNWNKRVQVGNKINNATQTKLLNLSIEGTEQEHQLLALQHNATEILQKQITNEKNILGNLTKHRIVANFTRDQIIDLQNQTERLIQQFNNTNENKRTEAVDNILTGVNNIIKQLNTTQQQSVANLTAQHDDILNIIKNNTK